MMLKSRTERDKFWLAVILTGYVFLALAYSVVNPAFESPDEIHHYAYVDYLLRERRLPVAELRGPQSEYHQPPLYYLLGTAISALVAPTRDLQEPERSVYESVQTNPFWGWRLGQVGVDNKNQYIHGPAEAFPYQDWVLRLHLVRWFSIVLEMLTVLATFLVGREIFPDQPALRLGALGFVAFLPEFLFIAGSVTNDNLIIPLAALTTWLLVRTLKRGITPWLSLALGILVGLAVLAKISGLALLAVVLIVLALIGWRDRAWKQMAWALGAVIGLSALVAGPILIRNMRVYGEPTALQRMSAIWGEHNPPLSYGEALREIPNVWTSFWARFGYGQIPLPNMIYQGLLVVVGLAGAGLILWFVRERRRLAAVTIWQILLLVVVGAGYGFSVVTYIRVSLTGANGRFAFPALPAYATLLFLGLSGLTPRRWHGVLAGAANVGMFAFAVAALAFWLRPAFAAPPLLKESVVPPHRVDWRFGDAVVLQGYALNRDAVSPGDDLTVTLYWQALSPMIRDYTVFVHLLGPRGQLVGARDTYPGLGRFPTTQWKPGDALADPVLVPIRLDASTVAPAAARLEIGLYDLATGARLPVADAAGHPIDFPVVGRVKLSPLQWSQVTPAVPDLRDFGKEIALLGYDVPATARPGDAFEFTLYWEAKTRPTRDYTVFVHLLNSSGKMVAQADGQPLEGRYPTDLWAAPEKLADRHSLRLPADLAPGDYRLRIGLYALADGHRVPVLNGASDQGDDGVTLPLIRLGS